MKPKKFIERIRHADIVSAIGHAEKKTSGEIRVFISRHQVQDPLSGAQKHFVEMGMEKTRDRNAVLIFIAPCSHKFAVVGDTAVHTRCGEEFWQQLTAEMTGHFRKGDFTAGIVHGVQKAGEILARHFPRRPDDRNELPDAVGHD
jgi:uncharacterized membrane protein